MLPKAHLILGAIFSLLLFFVFNISFFPALIIFLSSFLIDIDHYFYGVYKKKIFNPRKIYNFFKEERDKWRKLSYEQKLKPRFPILLLHGFEFILILTALSFLNNLFLFVLVGVSFHMLLDYLDILINKDPLFTKLSVLYVLLTNKTKKEL